MEKVTTKLESVELAAEVNDVCVLVKEVVLTLKAKGDVAALLPAAVKAVDGLGEAVSELKAVPFKVARTVALRAIDTVEALVSPAVVKPIAP